MSKYDIIADTMENRSYQHLNADACARFAQASGLFAIAHQLSRIADAMEANKKHVDSE